MRIFTTTYQGESQTFVLRDMGEYKYRVQGSQMWSDLYSSIGITSAEWHIDKKEYIRLAKIYDKLYTLWDNIQHELWIKGNSPMRYKVEYKEEHDGYRFLDINDKKVKKSLEKIISKIKGLI